MHVIGILVSVLGLLEHMRKIIWSSDCVPMEGGSAQARVYARLSVRERELLDYIKMKSLPMFGELLKCLDAKFDAVRNTVVPFVYITTSAI